MIAHEIGHFQLHHDPHNEVTVRPHGLGGDSVDSGAGRVEGYSPGERKEVQADIFADEFLCPSDWLRKAYVTHGKRPYEIAAELGLPVVLVSNQMARALLLPPLSPANQGPPNVDHALDDSQKIAVTWDKGPLLVDAGPGTDVWVVADPRQSIYLFRGAEPLNVANFTKVFGGTRHALANNYRSFAPIVRTFERFSSVMRGGRTSGAWTAKRATGGHVSLTVAPTLAAECEAIAENISQLRTKDVPHGDQAILARSGSVDILRLSQGARGGRG